MEYDVTHHYRDWKKQDSKNDFRDFSLEHLREFWSIIWERSEVYGVERPKQALGAFQLIGQLRNTRLTALTKSGVQLELDRWQALWPEDSPADLSDLFKERYELEVEDRLENSGKVEEVIHDLFGSLDIPIIRGSLPKMLFALLLSRQPLNLAKSDIQKIRELDRRLENEQNHRPSCDLCMKTFDDSQHTSLAAKQKAMGVT